ncbi:aldehyde dehydrogenase family protein [Roseicella aerolata]|uniref:Aldehyde dehydrogenase n=1 Tax=Roseicella aerolata TaxID=2883479 RepID=A0A9X1I9U4_9PROT|nr:aldehyde dehydrogenase family protein [Roseicella aerolata]
MPDTALPTEAIEGPAAALAALRALAAQEGVLPPGRRQDLLRALAALLLRRADAIAVALDADYGGRCIEETLLAEVKLVVDAARHSAARLHRWAKPRRAGVPFPFWPARAAIEPVPKGVIGIMAPWNYPLQLALLPAVDAVAAGNRVVLKPAEATPRTAALLAELLAEAWGQDIARVIPGGPDVAAAFAAQPWDHLVFTGGTETGRKVMQAAAANLVPLTLELGGKCPALVLPGADLAEAARAILAGKAINAGQTCIAPDTVLLVGHAPAEFAAACRASGIGLPDTVVVNDRQAARLDALCAGAALTPLAAPGAGRHRALALAEAPPGHPLHQDEIFGPVLAMQPLPDLAAAIAWIAARPRPLAIYLFGATWREEAQVAAATRSGALVSGRCVEYAAFPALPFGGTGASGFGRRNGEAGFLEFSLLRARVTHGRWSLSRLLDPPRTERSRKLIRQVLTLGS